MSMNESDDLEFAIALSLSSHNQEKPIEAEENDLRLAMRLQEELNAHPPNPPIPSSSSSSFFSSYLSPHFSGIRDTFQALLPTCSSCHSQWTGLIPIRIQNKVFCRNCFRCTICNSSITSSYIYSEDKVYCPPCATIHLYKYCSLCAQPIQGAYRKHIFLTDEIYCFHHTSTSSSLPHSCCACQRLEPYASSGKDLFQALSDGRYLCTQCSLTAVVDSSEAEEIYQQVLLFMERELKLVLPPGTRVVPILAVDMLSLNEQQSQVSTQCSHDNNSSNNNILTQAHVRGLTISSNSARVISYQTTEREGGVGGGFLRRLFTTSSSSSSSSSSVVEIDESREVSAVLVLFGLPKDLTASILAHEAMHVYLKLSKEFSFHLPPEVEEGLCQVSAYKYLESLRKGDSDKDAELRNYFLYTIETDPSPVYGDGFRNARKVVDALGLNLTLELVATGNGSLPNID